MTQHRAINTWCSVAGIPVKAKDCPECVEAGATMPALTLWQPWASLVAFGVKTVETRGWATKHRGRIAIHAAKSPQRVEPAVVALPEFHDALWPHLGFQARPMPTAVRHRLPRGVILATANLVEVIPVDRITSWFPDGGIGWENRWALGEDCAAVEDGERPLGDFSPGRYAWLLADIEPLAEPVPFRGGQALSRRWEP